MAATNTTPSSTAIIAIVEPEIPEDAFIGESSANGFGSRQLTQMPLQLAGLARGSLSTLEAGMAVRRCLKSACSSVASMTGLFAAMFILSHGSSFMLNRQGASIG